MLSLQTKSTNRDGDDYWETGSYAHPLEDYFNGTDVSYTYNVRPKIPSYYLFLYYLRILSKNVISLFRNFHWSNISSFFFSCFFLLLFWFSRVLGFSLLLLLVEFFSLVQLSVRLLLLLLPLLKYLHLHYYCYCLLSRGWYLVLSKEEEIKVGIVTKTEISKAITITIKRKPSGFFIYSYYIYSVFLFL